MRKKLITFFTLLIFGLSSTSISAVNMISTAENPALFDSTQNYDTNVGDLNAITDLRAPVLDDDQGRVEIDIQFITDDDPAGCYLSIPNPDSFAASITIEPTIANGYQLLGYQYYAFLNQDGPDDAFGGANNDNDTAQNIDFDHISLVFESTNIDCLKVVASRTSQEPVKAHLEPEIIVLVKALFAPDPVSVNSLIYRYTDPFVTTAPVYNTNAIIIDLGAGNVAIHRSDSTGEMLPDSVALNNYSWPEDLPMGTNLWFEAIPNPGYRFLFWIIEEEEIIINDSSIEGPRPMMRMIAPNYTHDLTNPRFEMVTHYGQTFSPRAVFLETFTVTYQLEGGNIGGNPADVITTIDSGNPVQEPVDPVRSGFNFNGWLYDSLYFNEDNQGNPIPVPFDTERVIADGVAHAQWLPIVVEQPEPETRPTEPETIPEEPIPEALRYNLTVFSTEGGTVPGKEGTTTYDAGTIVSVTPVSDEGYQFAGWEGDSVINGRITMDSDKTIKAVFEPKPTAVMEPQEPEPEIIDDPDIPQDAPAELPKSGGIPLEAFLFLGAGLAIIGTLVKTPKK